MSDKFYRHAVETIIKKLDIELKGKYDPKSDDMTGSYFIDGRETYIPFPCNIEMLFDCLFWSFYKRKKSDWEFEDTPRPKFFF